jgi:hypothetical protein
MPSRAHWSTRFGLAPDAALEAASGEFADLLVAAWSDAAALHRDAAWMRAAAIRSIDDPKQPIRIAMIQHLPAADQRDVLATLFASRRLDVQALQQALGELNVAFDPALSDLAIAAVERVRQGSASAYDYALPGLLDALAHLLWPGVIDALGTRWSGGAWEPNRRALDGFFQTLRIRRDIQTEFRP